jgi:hypothetical protein
MKTNSIHDLLVEELMGTIKKDYLRLFARAHYGYVTGCMGEIDIFAWKKDLLDFYEVKCHNGIYLLEKAVIQLKIARNHFGFSGQEFIYTPEQKVQTLEEVVHGFCLHSRMRVARRLAEKGIVYSP